MTSVNEMNAHSRGKREGYHDGYEEGFEVGWKRCNEKHRRERKVLRRMRIAIYIIIALALGFAWTNDTHAQATVPTSLSVVIKTQVTAEVSCNPTNCPEIGAEEPQVIENTQGESIFSRIWSAILRALT